MSVCALCIERCGESTLNERNAGMNRGSEFTGNIHSERFEIARHTKEKTTSWQGHTDTHEVSTTEIRFQHVSTRGNKPLLTHWSCSPTLVASPSRSFYVPDSIMVCFILSRRWFCKSLRRRHIPTPLLGKIFDCNLLGNVLPLPFIHFLPTNGLPKVTFKCCFAECFQCKLRD